VGEYVVTGVLSDRPIYKHVAKEEFVFFLTSKARGLWMVGPKPGHYNGGLAHKGMNTIVGKKISLNKNIETVYIIFSRVIFIPPVKSSKIYFEVQFIALYTRVS
jgi:hypothetical protein